MWSIERWNRQCRCFCLDNLECNATPLWESCFIQDWQELLLSSLPLPRTKGSPDQALCTSWSPWCYLFSTDQTVSQTSWLLLWVPQFLVAPSTLDDGIEQTVSHKHWVASAVLPVLLLMLKNRATIKGVSCQLPMGKTRAIFQKEKQIILYKNPILTMPKNHSKIIKGAF